MNFVLHGALGGGGMASLHSDPLAKTFGSSAYCPTIARPFHAIPPCGKIGFRGKLSAIPPPPRTVFGLRQAICTERRKGVAAIVCEGGGGLGPTPSASAPPGNGLGLL